MFLRPCLPFYGMIKSKHLCKGMAMSAFSKNYMFFFFKCCPNCTQVCQKLYVVFVFDTNIFDWRDEDKRFFPCLGTKITTISRSRLHQHSATKGYYARLGRSFLFLFEQPPAVTSNECLIKACKENLIKNLFIIMRDEMTNLNRNLTLILFLIVLLLKL